MEVWNSSPEEIKKKIENMTWSFSRVNSLSQCKYCWILSYVEGNEELPNAYAQFGTLCHETLEKFLKGELNIFNAIEYYREHYPEYVTCDFPPNKYVDLGQKTYDQGEEYFLNLDFDFDKYEILGVEKEVRFKVGKYPFKGFIDLLLRDKETKEVIIVDHKTSSFTYLKRGGVSKADADHFTAFRRQLYLYSIPVIEKYGKVDYLVWNMIRDQRKIKIPFNEAEYLEAQNWATKQIQGAENELLWLPDNSKSFWCNCICSQRASCLYHGN